MTLFSLNSGPPRPALLVAKTADRALQMIKTKIIVSNIVCMNWKSAARMFPLYPYQYDRLARDCTLCNCRLVRTVVQRLCQCILHCTNQLFVLVDSCIYMMNLTCE